MSIPIDQLRKTDLSLLVYFVVLVEEKTVSKAAVRLNLTQPALTRSIQRLREIFRDDLVVRTNMGYHPTPRGQDLLTQLADILPKLDDLISGRPFDPTTGETVFNITAADSLSYVYAPILAQRHCNMPQISFSFSTYGEDRYADLETNAQDLVLDAQYKSLGGGLKNEVLFEEELVCAVAKESSFANSLTLKAYLAARHITITTLHDIQAIPDLAFAREGLRRKSPFRVPQFAAGLAMVADSDLMATLPMSLAVMLMDPKTTRLIRPPKEIEPYRYIMVWHRRQDSDHRHVWLRQTMRSSTKDFLAMIAAKERLLPRGTPQRSVPLIEAVASHH